MPSQVKHRKRRKRRTASAVVPGHPDASTTTDFEICIYDRPASFLESRLPPQSPPFITLVPPRYSSAETEAYIVDKMVTPFADDVPPEQEHKVRYVLNYVVAWPATDSHSGRYCDDDGVVRSSYTCHLVPCPRILDYVSPRALEDYEYALMLRQRQWAGEEDGDAEAKGRETTEGESHRSKRPKLESDSQSENPSDARSQRRRRRGAGAGGGPGGKQRRPSRLKRLQPAHWELQANQASSSRTAESSTEDTTAPPSPTLGISAAMPSMPSRLTISLPSANVTPTAKVPFSSFPGTTPTTTSTTTDASTDTTPRPTSSQVLLAQSIPSRVSEHQRTGLSLTQSPHQQRLYRIPSSLEAGEEKLDNSEVESSEAEDGNEMEGADVLVDVNAEVVDSEADKSAEEDEGEGEGENKGEDKGDKGDKGDKENEEEKEAEEDEGEEEAEEDEEESEDEECISSGPVISQILEGRTRSLPLLSHEPEQPLAPYVRRVTHIPPPEIPKQIPQEIPKQTAPPTQRITPIPLPKIPGMQPLPLQRKRKYDEIENPNLLPSTVITSTRSASPRLIHKYSSGYESGSAAPTAEGKKESVETKDLYEVERIEDDVLSFGKEPGHSEVRVGSCGGQPVRFYLVRWKGDWPADQNPTWEPAENLPPLVIEQYMKQIAPKKPDCEASPFAVARAEDFQGQSHIISEPVDLHCPNM